METVYHIVTGICMYTYSDGDAEKCHIFFVFGPNLRLSLFLIHCWNCSYQNTDQKSNESHVGVTYHQD